MRRGRDSKWIVAGGPVDVRTFVTSPAYLNALDDQGNSVLYPAVLDAFLGGGAPAVSLDATHFTQGFAAKDSYGFSLESRFSMTAIAMA